MDREEIKKIENPIVRRALGTRCGDFMFNYSDSGHTHSDSSGYDEYRRQSGHSEGYSDDSYYTQRSGHKDFYRDEAYSERSSHTDSTKRSRGHRDYTDEPTHTERHRYGDFYR